MIIMALITEIPTLPLSIFKSETYNVIGINLDLMCIDLHQIIKIIEIVRGGVYRDSTSYTCELETEYQAEISCIID